MAKRKEIYTVKSNEKIGKYLVKLIEKNGYESVRKFGRAYLIEQNKVEPTEEELGKMSNRLSQIKKGNKAVQIYDLPIFSKLLNVSAEEILSAGETFGTYNDRMTNYKFAQSKDKTVWESYLNREDAIVLNTDEYGKTFLDYAIEFENYELIRYLVDEGYIWFDDGNKNNYVLTFGAGTKIKPKSPYDFGQFANEIATKDELRQKVILLAIKNKDIKMLNELKARELPDLYNAEIPFRNTAITHTFCSTKIIRGLTSADKEIIDYFSEDFEITNNMKHKFTFMCPFINDLINELIKQKYDSIDEILVRCKNHNEDTYHKAQYMLNQTKESLKLRLGDCDVNIAEQNAIATFQNDFSYDDKNEIISILGLCTNTTLATNIIKITTKSNDSKINNLIKEINELHNKILELKTSKEI